MAKPTTERRKPTKSRLATSILLLSMVLTIAAMNSGTIAFPSGNQILAPSSTLTASFCFTPIIPYANITVTFDASASYDPDGVIISYRWDFGDSSPVAVEGDPFTHHAYMSPGNYTITLTVTNGLGESNSISQSITVIPYPSGPWIDIYTQRGGEGLNEPDGYFAPGEIADLYALVTYNSIGVAGKMVAFEIRDPTGTNLIFRSAETDLDGIATINFTIPVTGPPEQIIGTWTALAVSSISEQIVSDTVTFFVTGLIIDLYTQKPDPYSGKGPHMPSDAFGPQEEVILYAYVTFDLEPIANKMVTFEVQDPTGAIFYRTDNTDEGGIATVSFRIPWMGMDAEELFGIWHILARVEVIGYVAEDTLTFQFGWILELTELATVDHLGESKVNFMRGEDIYFNITVTNIAFTSKIATFTFAAYDAAGVIIGHTTLPSWSVPPGTLQIFVIDLRIPEWSFSGPGIVYSNAYTHLPQHHGVPYCPEVSVPFTIVLA